jgi:hypothetical protein
MILMRKWILIVVSLLVSGIFLWLALRGVPLAEVAENIRQANLFWIVVSFLTVGGALWTRGVRWSGLIDNRVPVMTGFYIFSVTMLINQASCARARSCGHCWRGATCRRW